MDVRVVVDVSFLRTLTRAHVMWLAERTNLRKALQICQESTFNIPFHRNLYKL